MNDFTKEELMDLRSMMVDWHEKEDVSQITDDKLLDKIQAMIVNYCEPLNESNPMYRCIRCESKAVDIWYEIKYGLHNWFLCTECTPQFRDWVLDKNADNGCPWAKEHFKRKYGDK